MSQTAGYSTFNLDIADCMEEAYERVGREMRSGYDAITARRSLNLLMQELTNRGVNLWTVEQVQMPVIQFQSVYQISDDTADILPDAVIRQPNFNNTIQKNFDFPCTRWQRDQYLAMPVKDQRARPYYFLLERLRDNPQLTFWPVPDLTTYIFIYWRIRYLENDDDGSFNPDLPRRFLPALVAGLAFYIAMKAPDLVEVPRRQELWNEFDRQLKLAMAEDHDRSATILTPQLRRR